jgi:GTP-binding protein HflX
MESFFMEKEKGILVGVQLPSYVNFEYSMEELENLAFACEIEVVAQVTQKLPQVNRSFYVGKGKMEEIEQIISMTQADLVITNDELSPSQIRNLERKLDIKVIDRTMLILEIFAQRAKTKEAQLQVEVALLEYMLPRLTGKGVYLDRQGGGAGFKNRGAGETKLELDRRKIKTRIASLNKELEAVVSQRKTQRKQRQKSGIPIVSLVGYTNAGKSTIMNAMVKRFISATHKEVFEKDMLFATLDTSVRQIKLPDNKSFLLTDTVGFVDKLPHYLIKAFRSTLEIVAEADLLIHVVDCSNPQFEELMYITNQTLKEIGMEDIPMIYAYNKADLANLPFPKVENDIVYLSAKQSVGIDELVQLIRSRIFQDYVQCEMLIPFEQGNLLSYLNKNTTILSTSYEPIGTKLLLECKISDYHKYQEFVVRE